MLDRVKLERPALARALERAALLHFGPGSVCLAYKEGSMLAPHVAEASAVAYLATACEVVTGHRPAITFEILPGTRPAPRARQHAERGPRR